MGTDGADLQAAVNVDLGDAMLDALLTLNPPSPASGAAHPTLMVALKGPLPAPKRTVDTALLTSWLTLRGLEQQSRQLEAMEKAARESAAAAGAPPPAAAPNSTDGISGKVQAPVLPPPITIAPAPQPRMPPRTDNMTPPGGAP